jgi:hypothetical protein
MKVTSESTSVDDRERERREGSVLWGKTKALLDEHDSLKAEVQRLQVMVPDDAYARACRTAKLEQLILAALDNSTLRVALLAVTPCYRTSKVREHLRDNLTRYNITKPPHPDTIRTILRKHGWL